MFCVICGSTTNAIFVQTLFAVDGVIPFKMVPFAAGMYVLGDSTGTWIIGIPALLALTKYIKRTPLMRKGYFS
jgi:hypothetical protein